MNGDETEVTSLILFWMVVRHLGLVFIQERSINVILNMAIVQDTKLSRRYFNFGFVLMNFHITFTYKPDESFQEYKDIKILLKQYLENKLVKADLTRDFSYVYLTIRLTF